jgi:hypothetical protein
VLSEAWLGVWRGSLTLSPPLKGFPATSPMELRIATKDSAKGPWSWVLAYSGQPERAYELLADPQRPGAFLLDEKNGIVLDMTLEGGELLSAFEVSGRLLLTRYTLTPSSIRYETRTFERGEPSPQKVISWKPRSFQSAVLKRS